MKLLFMHRPSLARDTFPESSSGNKAKVEATFMASTLLLDLKRTIQAKISG